MTRCAFHRWRLLLTTVRGRHYYRRWHCTCCGARQGMLSARRYS